MQLRSSRLIILLSVVLLSACQGDVITSTWVPKENSAIHSTAHHHGETKEQPVRPVHWTKPPSWKEAPPAQMRVASFSFASKSGEKADISVVRLAGDGGGLLANVNRWRGQIGLGPVTQQELENTAERLTIDGHRMLVFDFHKDGSRMLTAVYEVDGESWYFKMTGGDKTLQEARSSYFQFLKSVHAHHP